MHQSDYSWQFSVHLSDCLRSAMAQSQCRSFKLLPCVPINQLSKVPLMQRRRSVDGAFRAGQEDAIVIFSIHQRMTMIDGPIILVWNLMPSSAELMKGHHVPLYYRVFHLRMCFLKGLKMSENHYVDKKKRQ